MKILALETSCDDTAVSVVENGTRVLAFIRMEQMEHAVYGGVVPEIAARLHSENWRNALEACLKEARVTIDDIDYFAVTNGPGLQTALLNGTTVASFLSLVYNKPVIPVHHIFGHICSVFLGRNIADVVFPSLVLVASGGHTEIYLWKSATELQKLGKTIDDAVGEAFDKVAKMLGLGYPGGPVVSEWAQKGDPQKFVFPRILLGKDSLDFSFSGLKAAVYRAVTIHEGEKDEVFIADICASFEQAVVDTICKKIAISLEKHNARQLHFVGGVSANVALNKALYDLCNKKAIDLFTPVKLSYSTDNAAMIGSAAYFLVQGDPGVAKVRFLEAEPRLEM